MALQSALANPNVEQAHEVQAGETPYGIAQAKLKDLEALLPQEQGKANALGEEFSKWLEDPNNPAGRDADNVGQPIQPGETLNLAKFREHMLEQHALRTSTSSTIAPLEESKLPEQAPEAEELVLPQVSSSKFPIVTVEKYQAGVSNPNSTSFSIIRNAQADISVNDSLDLIPNIANLSPSEVRDKLNETLMENPELLDKLIQSASPNFHAVTLGRLRNAQGLKVQIQPGEQIDLNEVFSRENFIETMALLEGEGSYFNNFILPEGEKRPIPTNIDMQNTDPATLSVGDIEQNISKEGVQYTSLVRGKYNTAIYNDLVDPTEVKGWVVDGSLEQLVHQSVESTFKNWDRISNSDVPQFFENSGIEFNQMNVARFMVGIACKESSCDHELVAGGGDTGWFQFTRIGTEDIWNETMSHLGEEIQVKVEKEAGSLKWPEKDELRKEVIKIPEVAAELMIQNMIHNSGIIEDFAGTQGVSFLSIAHHRGPYHILGMDDATQASINTQYGNYSTKAFAYADNPTVVGMVHNKIEEIRESPNRSRETLLASR